MISTAGDEKVQPAGARGRRTDRKGGERMHNIVGQLTGFVIPVVAIIAVFTFIIVANWAEERRKEREAYYRSETYRKAIEQGGDSARMVLGLMREEDLRRMKRRIEGLRLGGLITTAVGAGIMVFLYFLVEDEPVWLAGLLPFLIGVVLVVYGFASRVDEKPPPLDS
jgi:hypothetical protein